MFATLLGRSFMMRKVRFLLPTIALLIGVSIASSLLMVTISIEDRVARELRAFGPNLIVVPRSDDIELTVGGISLGSVTESDYISEQDARLIRELPLDVFGDKVKGILGKNAYLYALVQADEKKDIIIAGTWFDELQNVNLWWEIEGSYPKDPTYAVIGARAAQILDKGIGDPITLRYSGTRYFNGVYAAIDKNVTLFVAGIVTTGGDDDSRLFADLDLVQNLTGKDGKVNIMHISALCNECPLEDIVEVLEDKMPGIQVKTVKQVAQAEMDMLNLVKSLVGIIAGVSIVASILAVTTTFSMSVVERRKEIGLMKAVGAQGLNVMALFMSEGLIISMIAGVMGFFCGALISGFIGKWVFDKTIDLRWTILLFSLSLSVVIVVVAMLLPLRMAVRVDPAVVLRGE